YFFFQAEDGIRDLYVTGVQTCALPICRPNTSWMPATSMRDCWLEAGETMPLRWKGRSALCRSGQRKLNKPTSSATSSSTGSTSRSEERRVGKECRARGWQEEEKKKSEI